MKFFETSAKTGQNINDVFYSIAQCALKNYSNMQTLLKYGEAPFIRPKLFVCGRERSGKTTLIRTLKRSFLEGVFTPERISFNEPDKTRGIENQSCNIRNGEEFNIWDFAGDVEYYITHEMFLAFNEAAFVVVCDLSKPEKERNKIVWYWLKFIKTRFDPSIFESNEDIKPFIVICGSKRDVVLSDGSGVVSKEQRGKWRCLWGENLILEANQKFSKYLNIHQQFFVVDCRSSNSQVIESFRNVLNEWRNQTLQQAPKVPALCEKVISFLNETRIESNQTRISYSQLCSTIETKLELDDFLEKHFKHLLRLQYFFEYS